jgi:hypothetical protein
MDQAQHGMVNLSRQLKSKLKLLWVLIYSRLSRAPNSILARSRVRYI